MRAWLLWIPAAGILWSLVALHPGCGEAFKSDPGASGGGAGGEFATSTGAGHAGGGESGAGGTAGGGAAGLGGTGPTDGGPPPDGNTADADDCRTCLEWADSCVGGGGDGSCSTADLCSWSLPLATDLRDCLCQACTVACPSCPSSQPSTSCRTCMQSTAAGGLCDFDLDACSLDYPDG